MAEWPIDPPQSAFVMGADTPYPQYGQGITNDFVKAISQPSLNPLDLLGSLADMLARLPLEALQLFKDFIPDVLEGAFETVTGAVNAILEWLSPRKLVMYVEDFADFLADGLQQILDKLAELTAPIPIVGQVTDALADWLAALRHDTDNAQQSAAQANASLALIMSDGQGSGTVYKDDFNREAASDLGPDYFRTSSSGSAVWGTDGNGNVHGQAFGSTPQDFTDRRVDPIQDGLGNPSVRQGMQIVVSTPPAAAAGFGTYSCQVKMKLRCDTTNATCVVATLDGPSSVEIGYELSGSYTRLAQTDLAIPDGGRWEFLAGVGTNDYEFVLRLNGTDVLGGSAASGPVVDTLHASQLGAGYEYGALASRFGTAVFWWTFQTGPPDVQVLTIYDRTP